MILKSLKNGNAILVFDYFLIAWFIGALIQHFRETHWDLWFWLFYLCSWVVAPPVIIFIIAAYAFAMGEKALHPAE